MDLYIPREIDDIFRRAMIPEFPSLFKNNPKDVFQAEYSCKNFFVHVFMAQDKEAFGEIDFSFEEMEFIDARFQQAIGNWLMDKKAQSGNDEVTGNLDSLAKDIFGQHKVRLFLVVYLSWVYGFFDVD